MNKGESKLTKTEIKSLSVLSIAAEAYEEKVLGLKPFKEPDTLAEIVELKLFENKMTQAVLADQIGLAKSKVSEILNGKRKADIPFLKGIHKVLKIDAGFAGRVLFSLVVVALSGVERNLCGQRSGFNDFASGL